VGGNDNADSTTLFWSIFADCVIRCLWCWFAVFDMVDPKFRELWMKSWLEIYWPLWSVFFAPCAISALLATWLSRLTKGKVAALLLGEFLLLILAAIEIAWVLDPYIGRKGPWFLLGAFAFLSTVFVAIAMVVRVRRPQHQPAL
jgi:hypothetical protein